MTFPNDRPILTETSSALRMPEQFCEWEKVLSTDVTTYHAACDTQWRKRKEKYCPNCGKPIKEVTE